MKKALKKISHTIIYLLVAILILALALAYNPAKSIVNHPGISPERATELRLGFEAPHHEFNTSDGITLFLRRWDPDSLVKKDIAVLIFHGITAHSGAYAMVGEPLSKSGYTTFGLDYRGHGLSGGNRADCPDRERWVADLSESVDFLHGLGFSRVILLGHSFGVAGAIYTARAIPDKVAGLILLSGAYRGRPGVSTQPSLLQKMKILSSSVLRPSVQVVEYYREGMTGTEDPLFNFKYTLRFIRMLDREELILPSNLNIPVLVGLGDKDELFEIGAVKELFDDIPGDNKEFLILEGAYHARFPPESWDSLAAWLNKNY